ncbi:hypothetical protein KV557_13860 [Kitasatospora aureofaciens]|uniref:hypothetical protein n=1 Tax=Kitasatospora aureofaciens TaxID=1894 RepID=UPI001C4771A9|nr:hypothetical protein [Kitasatospora aureofaciens]MBV6698212.1 hypothetical protein [Kitasatospora aureofaciens]
MSQPQPAAYSYREVTPDEQFLSAWTVSPTTGLPTSATGPCPRCGHSCLMPVTTKIIAGAATAPATEAPSPPPEPLTLQFVCTCGEAHDSRPAGPYRLRPAQDRRRAEAAIALRAAATTQGADVRAAAEKWLTGITALYGLFGLAGVVAGRTTIASLGTAGKTTVAAAALLGIASAGGAILTGYRAAYGWPVAQPVADDTELARWKARHDAYAFSAAADLRRAVALAVAALGALVLTVGLIWFLPAKSSAGSPPNLVDAGSARSGKSTTPTSHSAPSARFASSHLSTSRWNVSSLSVSLIVLT